MQREVTREPARRSSAEVWPGAIARVLVLALVVVGAWIGPQSGGTAWVWAPALVAFACWIISPELSEPRTVSVPALLLPLGVAALFAGLQLIPLSSVALESVSPLAKQWWGLVDLAAVPDAGRDLESAVKNHPVSLYPWGGRQSLAGLVLLTISLLIGTRFFRRTIPFAWMCIALAVAATLQVISLSLGWAWIPFARPPAGDPVPLVFAAIAAALGLLFGRGALRQYLGIYAFAASATLCVLLHVGFLVPAAGAASVALGMLVSKSAARRVLIPVVVFATAVAPWLVAGSPFRLPTTWEPFLRVGSGFGSAVLLQTDRPSNNLAAENFAARLMVEGGWPALIIAVAGLAFFARALVALANSDDQDRRSFLAAGLFFGPTAVAWLGVTDWPGSPYLLVIATVFVGAIAGRAALVAPTGRPSAGFVMPRLLPAPTFGALLFAASLWAAWVAWTAERTALTLAAASIEVTPQTTIEKVDTAIFRLQPLARQGDALALWTLSERRIDRFRLQAAAQLSSQLKLAPEEAWRRSDPAELFATANAWGRTKQSAQLDALRREAAVVQNLEPARNELRSALAASPLAAEIALRNVQLDFVSDAPVNEAPLLQLAAARAAPRPDLLYAIGLEEYFAGRTDRAAELWKSTLRLSLDKLAPICRLLGRRALEGVLPDDPEAFLTFAETLPPDDRNAVTKIAVLDLARRSLDRVQLPPAVREFHLGRWHAGLGEWPQAVEAFRAAVRDQDDNLRFRLTLAAALEYQGDKVGALEQARQALSTNPSNADVKAMVQRLERAVRAPAGKSDAKAKK